MWRNGPTYIASSIFTGNPPGVLLTEPDKIILEAAAKRSRKLKNTRKQVFLNGWKSKLYFEAGSSQRKPSRRHVFLAPKMIDASDDCSDAGCVLQVQIGADQERLLYPSFFITLYLFYVIIQLLVFVRSSLWLQYVVLVELVCYVWLK